MLKVRFTQNLAMLDITNSNSEILILNPKEAKGILDLRLLQNTAGCTATKHT